MVLALKRINAFGVFGTGGANDIYETTRNQHVLKQYDVHRCFCDDGKPGGGGPGKPGGVFVSMDIAGGGGFDMMMMMLLMMMMILIIKDNYIIIPGIEYIIIIIMITSKSKKKKLQ